MITEELYLELAESQTDLARYVEAATRSDLPYVVVSSDAVRAWRRREPETWARVSDWLASQGKAVVEI